MTDVVPGSVTITNPTITSSTSEPNPGRRSGSQVKRACDQCKFRKISLSQPCKICVTKGFACTFNQPQKKRGPVGKRLSEIRRQQDALSPPERSRQLGTSSASLNSPSPAESSRNELDSGNSSSIHRHGASHGQSQGLSDPVDALGQERSSSIVMGSTWDPQMAMDGLHGANRAPWSDSPSDIEHWLPNTLALQPSSSVLPGTVTFMNASLPSIVQMGDQHPAGLTTFAAGPSHASEQEAPLGSEPPPATAHKTTHVWPASISESSLIPWIDMYFDRLYPTLPVLNRSSLFSRILSREHRHNPQFGAMLLSLCAFALTQPVQIKEQPTSSSRASQARSLMDEATKMRSSSDFGENPTLDAVLTSFFLFASLFGSNQHNAAWLRLREAVDLGATMRLHDPDSFQGLAIEEQDQRLRTYLVLSITERAYALQRRHPIGFRGRPGFNMRSIHKFIHSASKMVSGIIIHDDKDASVMRGLAQLMDLFEAIDEDIVDCWNGRCDTANSLCKTFDRNKALAMHQNLVDAVNPGGNRNSIWSSLYNFSAGDSEAGASSTALSETQRADILITQKWLQNCIWHLCLTHNLLQNQPEPPELNFQYAISIAESTVDLCASLSLRSMEVHGIGLIEKLYTIATSALTSSCWMSSLSHPNEATLSTETLPGLAQGFLKLLTTLRGGNHPYLERYLADLNQQPLVSDT